MREAHIPQNKLNRASAAGASSCEQALVMASRQTLIKKGLIMQQQSSPRSRAFSLFRARPLEEIPQTYSWFEEMRANRPVLQDGVMPLWQVFRYEDVLKVLTDYSRFSSKPLGAFTGSF